MNKLKETYNLFKLGKITKDDFTIKMHDMHKLLWDYQEFIRDCDINSIKIEKDDVKFVFASEITMICNPDDERPVPLEIINFGNYEVEELDMCKKFLKEDSVILDIGANLGWYVLNFSKNIPFGKILAFEPIPKTYNYLLRNIELNKIQNVECFNFGLSNQNGLLEFFYDPKLPAATSLRILHENRDKVKVSCEVKRLDDLISNKKLEKIDFIKCDVEGAELLVMEGAIKTLEKFKPVLFLEMLRKWSAKFNYHPNDIIHLLSKIGYSCYSIDNSKLNRVLQIDKNTIETNFFFLDEKIHTSFKNLIN